MARHGQRVHPGPGLQVDGQAQPGLHGIDVEVRAGVARLDAGGQRGDVLHGAGLVVDGHAGGQHGVFVDLGEEFGGVQRAVGFGRDFHNGKALAAQRASRQLDAGVLEPGDDDLAAPGAPRDGRAPQGHVVALGTAGGKVDFVAAAAQRFGYAGAGGVDGLLGLDRRVVQAAGVGPQRLDGAGDDVGHLRVHHGGGGVIQIMKMRVGTHGQKPRFSVRSGVRRRARGVISSPPVTA